MTTTSRIFAYAGLAAAVSFVSAIAARAAETTLLNVSYDVARELYKDINPAFSAAYKTASGETVTVNQSHGGSSKQALAVAGGLEADVVTMNQVPDIDLLVEKGGLVAADWQKKFPHNATPYTTTIVFLVRKGNPKGIKDWDDLTKAGTQVIVPNPKVTGNGRYTYLAAWGYALQKLGTPEAAKDFVTKLFANVPVLDGGGRGATTTFTQRAIGDVLVTFENETFLISKEVGADQFDVVYPSISIEAAPPVAVVDKVADKRGTRKVAEAYLNFLFSPEGQTIIAKHYFRPRDEAAFKASATKYPEIKTFQVEKLLGEWKKVNAEHFADGGTYDQIIVKR